MKVVVAGGRLVLEHVLVVDRLPKRNETVVHAGITRALRRSLYGGCAANIAVALAHLGFTPNLVSVSDCSSATRQYKEYLTRNGVRLDKMIDIEAASVPHSYNIYDLTGAKLGFIDEYYDDTSTGIYIETDFLVGAIVTIVGAAASDPLRPTLNDLARRARAVGSTVVQTLCSDDVAEISREAIELADVLICNEFEAQAIWAKLGTSANRALSTAGSVSRTAFITRGDRGSTVYSQNEETDVEPVPATQIPEPTGAGDAYAAGVIAGLAWGESPVISGQIGSVLAVCTVEHPGSQPGFPGSQLLLRRFVENYGRSPASLQRLAEGEAP